MGTNAREHILDRQLRLQNLLEDLMSNEYATDSPKLFLKNLYDLNDIFKKRVERNTQIDITSLRRIASFYEMMHFFLDDIEHIKSNNIPIELLPYINNILNDNTVDFKLVLRPDTEYNYSYRNFTKIMIEQCGIFGFDPKDNIGVISFPLSEKHNFYLIPILIHEIGHLLVDELKLKNKVSEKSLTVSAKNVTEYYEALKEQYSQVRTTLGISNVTLDNFILDEEHEKSKIAERLSEILEKWINEILADMIAFYYLGPAYLLAISELCNVSNSDNFYSDTHPPLFLRLKGLFKLYSQLEYGKKLMSYGNTTKYVAQLKKISTGSFNKLPRNPENLKCCAIEKKIVYSFKDMDNIIKSNIKIPKNQFISIQIKDAVESYLNLIPPNEFLNDKTRKKQIHSIYTILNAQWIVKENYRSKLESLIGNLQESRFIINKLAQKALELSEFSKWMEKDNDSS
jgi:hypothetical protein